MKKSSRLLVSILTLAAGLFVAKSAPAQHEQHNKKPAEESAPASKGKLLPVTDKEAAWAAKAREGYPLDVCVASDEKLGSMGESPEYIYREQGKPDRLVIFCCDGCEKDFMEEPAKYIAKMDAAAKNKGAPHRKADSMEHKGHHD